MRENNRVFGTDVNPTSILKLLDGVCASKWPSKYRVACQVDFVEWLPAYTTFEVELQVRGACTIN